MPGYDASRYDPPAPVAAVSLRPSSGAGSDSIADVQLLVDTGADVTLLPRAAVACLGTDVQVVAQQYELMGFDGTRSTVDAVDLDLLFLGKAFRGRYLLTDEDHGVLGRDVLNALKLLFDGPGEEWSEAKISAQ
jgi:hypothetical protein